MKMDQKPDTAHQIIDGEAVIITPGQMMVHVLNAVGSRIWDLADGERNIEDIAKVLSEEFDVSYNTVLRDTTEFTTDLAQKEMMGFAPDDQEKEEG
jgi:hypothetical protein